MPAARRRAAASSSNAGEMKMNKSNESNKHRACPSLSMMALAFLFLALFAAGPSPALAAGERSLLQKTVGEVIDSERIVWSRDMSRKDLIRWVLFFALSIG